MLAVRRGETGEILPNGSFFDTACDCPAFAYAQESKGRRLPRTLPTVPLLYSRAPIQSFIHCINLCNGLYIVHALSRADCIAIQRIQRIQYTAIQPIHYTALYRPPPPWLVRGGAPGYSCLVHQTVCACVVVCACALPHAGTPHFGDAVSVEKRG